MLRDASGFSHIYVITGRTDMRRGIDGLAAILQNQFGLNPFEEGSIFLFCGRRSDRIKALVYEGDGFLLLYKRVAIGRFQWPRTPDEVRDLSEDDFHHLMEGFSIEKTITQFTPKQL